MGKKIIIDEKFVISEYTKGKSSLVISKEMGVSKPTILKILKKNNVTRKRDRCSKLDIKSENGMYYVIRLCPGCNKEVKTKSKDKVIACRNHLDKLKGSSLCKPCSIKLQTGEGNPFYGKSHTKETKRQISNSRKGKGVGDKNSMSNLQWRQKSKENRLESIKNNPINFSNRSKNEIKIYNKIKKKYKNTTHSLVIKPYIYDIFIPELNLVIEYNGDYWHCNPLKYKPNYYHKLKNMLAEDIWNYDKTKIDLMKNNGYNLETIWEADYNSDPKLIYKIIAKYVKKN